jgi:protein-L-isoaspartate O-methyltransferase
MVRGGVIRIADLVNRKLNKISPFSKHCSTTFLASNSSSSSIASISPLPFIPEDLVAQLKVWGRMVAPIGDGDIQVMHLIEKISETETR